MESISIRRLLTIKRMSSSSLSEMMNTQSTSRCRVYYYWGSWGFGEDGYLFSGTRGEHWQLFSGIWRAGL